jgi:hypothetical protein
MSAPDALAAATLSMSDHVSEMARAAQAFVQDVISAAERQASRIRPALMWAAQAASAARRLTPDWVVALYQALATAAAAVGYRARGRRRSISMRHLLRLLLGLLRARQASLSEIAHREPGQPRVTRYLASVASFRAPPSAGMPR